MVPACRRQLAIPISGQRMQFSLSLQIQNLLISGSFCYMWQFLFTAHCQGSYCVLHIFASPYHGCVLDPDSSDWNKNHRNVDQVDNSNVKYYLLLCPPPHTPLQISHNAFNTLILKNHLSNRSRRRHHIGRE